MLRFGVVVTLIYLGFIISQVWFRLPSFYELGLNEVGDFLAGVLGPVSIFWLILSFKQQGDELRAQAAELSNSVVEQKKLVETSTGQFKAMMDSLELQRKTLALQHAPKIQVCSAISCCRNGSDFLIFTVLNSGKLAKFVEVYIEFAGVGEVPTVFASYNDLEFEASECVTVELDANDLIVGGRITVTYEDVFGGPYTYVCSLSPMANTNELKVSQIKINNAQC